MKKTENITEKELVIKNDLENKQDTENKNSCANCGKELVDDFHKIVNSEKQVLGLCDKCYKEIKAHEEAQSKNINYSYAILLGFLFSLVGAVLWYAVVYISKWQLGIVALGVGMLAGYGVKLGSGNKQSLNLQIISGVIAFISVIVGEYLILNHYLVDYLISQDELTKFEFLRFFPVLTSVFYSIKDDALKLIFWGIAVYTAFTFAKPFKLKKID